MAHSVVAHEMIGFRTRWTSFASFFDLSEDEAVLKEEDPPPMPDCQRVHNC